jgi:uncharacterized protein (DUF58 family)
MVKEFHPETQTTLQILIDAGRTMYQKSYVGTKLDEALAVAWLLTESAVGSGNSIGIWLYNDTEIVKRFESAGAEEQLAKLRQLALTHHAENADRVVRAPSSRALWPRKPKLLRAQRLAEFTRLLKFVLSSGHRRTGVYRTLTEATGKALRGFVVVLTDLQTNTGALLEAASAHSRDKRIIVTQIGARWRLSSTLEETYSEYEMSVRSLRRLQQSGLTVLDSRPEMVVEAILQQMIQHTTLRTTNSKFTYGENTEYG